MRRALEARDGTRVFTRPTGSVVELPERPPSSHEELTRSNQLEGREPEREPYAPEGAGENIDLDYHLGPVLSVTRSAAVTLSPRPL
jgi:hypothetical protein